MRFLCALAIAFRGAAQEPEILTVQDAVSIATKGNRTVAAAALDVRRVNDRIATEKTKLFPSLYTWALGGQLLTRPSVRFDPGVLGTYASTGPIPAARTDITSGRVPAGAVVAQVSLPLTQRIRISLTLRGLEMEKQLNQEMARERRLAVINDVKRTYYTLQQTESQLASAAESVALYREALRVTENNLKEQTVLQADLFEVRTRLARAELQTLELRNGLDTGSEQLNELLGREITTPFRTVAMPEEETLAADVADARRRAIASRPELAQARLRLQEASLDRRSKKAEYLPDVSLAINYFSTLHLSGVVPANVGAAGLQISWEPFDWGRKRHEAAEKQHVENQAELALAETESRILREVGAQFRKLEESRRELAVARLSQQTVAENLRVARNKYALQAALLKDVLEAQSASAEAASQYRQALARYWGARGDFEKSIGEDQ